MDGDIILLIFGFIFLKSISRKYKFSQVILIKLRNSLTWLNQKADEGNGVTYFGIKWQKTHLNHINYHVMHMKTTQE
jgi:hypothetical protein